MGIGWPQLLVIALVILVLFGRGRISEMMGDFGKGINSFKKGMNEEEKADSASPSKSSSQIEGPADGVADDKAANAAPKTSDKS